MGQIDELRQRAIESLEVEVTTLGGHAPGSAEINRPGVRAAVTPAAAERSLFNSVYYSDPVALAEALPDLERGYERAGVLAWTVWVPDEDRTTAALLAERGHTLDGSPRAMSFWLEELAEPPPAPDGVERDEAGTWPLIGRLNDAAYGYGEPAFEAALVEPGAAPVAWSLARVGEEPVACLGTIPNGDDVLVTAVATLPQWQGRGIASWLLHTALERARQAGARSASLRASKAGAPIYARLGFQDHGFVELWEHRRQGTGGA
ncbi:MAG: GNAT family N-acetyltransferase [Solirubrobacterales bacterium]